MTERETIPCRHEHHIRQDNSFFCHREVENQEFHRDSLEQTEPNWLSRTERGEVLDVAVLRIGLVRDMGKGRIGVRDRWRILSNAAKSTYIYIRFYRFYLSGVLEGFKSDDCKSPTSASFVRRQKGLFVCSCCLQIRVTLENRHVDRWRTKYTYPYMNGKLKEDSHSKN